MRNAQKQPTRRNEIPDRAYNRLLQSSTQLTSIRQLQLHHGARSNPRIPESTLYIPLPIPTIGGHPPLAHNRVNEESRAWEGRTGSPVRSLREKSVLVAGDGRYGMVGWRDRIECISIELLNGRGDGVVGAVLVGLVDELGWA